MKTIIIRKPKFMRSDETMRTYIEIAETISKEACSPELTPDQRFKFLKKTGECLNKAAKAGGFLNTNGMIKWFETHK